jgi:plasmid replication initiation protein
LKTSRRGLLVVKDNQLVEATYTLSLAEQRLLLFAIAQLDSRTAPGSRICLTITAAEIAETFGLSNVRAYNLLTEVAERLYERSVLIHAPDPERPEVEKELTRWVSRIRYIPQKGSVEMVFSEGIVPLLCSLREQFSRYRLEHVAQFSSSYAIRLYEMLIQWREKGARTVEIDWLRERFDLGGKYQNIRDFKARILKPAVEQINTHSDLWLDWEQHKRGRVVHALTFRYGLKSGSLSETNASSKPKAPAKLTRAYVERHARPGETWDQAEARLRRAQQ